MAKMFYTLEEAAAKLKIPADKVREMASSGQLQEFRDRDKLVFKREQVDLLSGGDKDEDTFKLADSGEIPLASDDSKSASGSGSGSGSASGPGMGSSAGGSKERSGISIFEDGETDDSDPLAATQVTSSSDVPGINMGDPGASGSGLLDLTQGEDTSAGANLLEDVYAGGDQGSADASGAPVGGGALFESSGVASDVATAAAGGAGVAMVAAEPYDSAWSGISGGLALGMVLVLGTMLVVVLLALMGATGGGIVGLFASNLWMWVGILAAVPFLLAAIGWFVGRRG